MLTSTQEQRLDSRIYTNAYVYLHQPELIFEAPLIDADEHDRAYVALNTGPETVGTMARIRPEMRLEISVNGRGDGGYQRVRGIVSPNKILIGRSSVGRGIGFVNPQAGATVRVYDDYRPFIKAPYVTADGVGRYMDETLYTTDQAAQPPVANFGSDRYILTTDPTAHVTLDALGPHPSFAVYAGATLQSFIWEIGDGTVVSGAVDEPDLVVSFPQGARWVSLNVVDSNGVAHRTSRLIVVQSPHDAIPATLETLSLSTQGATVSVTVDSQYLENVLPASKVLVAELENYGDATIGYAERFSGWMHEENYRKTDPKTQREQVSLSLVDISHFLKNNYLFPQSVNVAGELGGWYQMRNATIKRLIHYVLQWHTNALSLASFGFSGHSDLYPFPAYTTAGGDFYSDVNALAGAHAHQFTVDSRGHMDIVPNPDEQPTAAQAAAYSLPTHRDETAVTTLNEGRYGVVGLIAHPVPTSFWLNVTAGIASSSLGNVISCIAPSNAPSFGTSGGNITNWLVLNQNELNVRAGNHYAALLAPVQGDLRLSIKNPVHIIEPAARRFVNVVLPQFVRDRYNLPDDNNLRWTVTTVNYSYSSSGKTAEYILKKETFAPEPARTTDQTLDDEMVQGWSGFDESISTAGIPTIGFEPMTFNGLTQPELEETLNRTWLKVGVGQVTIGPDGTIDPEGGGGDDPHNQEDLAKDTGGYYEVTTSFNSLVGNLVTYYGTIDSLPTQDQKDRLNIYLLQVIPNAIPADVSDWVDYIVDVNDTVPTFTPASEREDATGEMFCENSARAGLINYAAGTAEADDWFPAIRAISDTLYNQWFQRGRNSPRDLYMNFPCVLQPVETVELSIQRINDSTRAYGILDIDWAARGQNGTALSIRVEGRYEDDNSVVDAFYTRNKTTGDITFTPMGLAVSKNDGSNSISIARDGQPNYSPSGVYTLSGTISGAPAQFSWPRRYAVFNDRAVVGTAVGAGFKVTFTDLGRR